MCHVCRDQLWTNDGQYKVPEPGQEYPLDLAVRICRYVCAVTHGLLTLVLQYYPEPNAGWMNEEGKRIDMKHRLVPKQPLRSVLKTNSGSLL